MHRVVMMGLVLVLSVAVSVPAVAAQDDLFEAEMTYLTQMGIVSNMVIEAFQFASESTESPMPSDPAWVAKFASVWSVFEVIQRTLDQVDVPPTFAMSFGFFQSSIDVMADNAAYCRAGFAIVDLATIDICSGFINQSNRLVQLATETMQAEAADAGIGS